MNNRMRKAEYLFDELGLIDDRIVAEAMGEGARSFSRGSASFRRVTAAIAAAAVLVTALVGSVIIGNMAKKNSEDGHFDELNEYAPKYLADALEGAEKSNKISSFDSADEIDLFDGEEKIIWRNEDGGEYFVLAISSYSDKQNLTRALNATYLLSKDISDDEAENTDVSVWISRGDGSVISPYLKNSAGNVGYGELFAYSPEIAPSDSFTDLVNGLISE